MLHSSFVVYLCTVSSEWITTKFSSLPWFLSSWLSSPLPVVNLTWVFLRNSYYHCPSLYLDGASLVAQLVKNLPAMRGTWVQSLGWEDPLEKGKATHSSTLAWRIPWTPWGPKESDTTEQLSLSLSSTFILWCSWSWSMASEFFLSSNLAENFRIIFVLYFVHPVVKVSPI